MSVNDPQLLVHVPVVQVHMYEYYTDWLHVFT